MDKKLLAQAAVKYLAGLVAVSILLFLPAGTLGYPNGWLFVGVLFVPMLITGLVLAAKNPELLRKRLDAKEKQQEQKGLITFSALMFVAGFVLAGLDFRFGWLSLPGWVSYAAAAVFLLGYLLFAEVLRENEYLSRTVEVQQNQKVIDTGLYGVIRHPMYAATMLMFLSMLLVLGSLISFFAFLFYPVITVKRIHGEEALLEKELSGYAEYKKRVRYRLIPFVW